MSLSIQPYTKGDFDSLTRIYEACFPREFHYATWLQANINAFPRMVYYVGIYNDEIIGYAQWVVKSGFRDKSVLELEQLAVHPDFSGKGFGKRLVADSYPQFVAHLETMGVAPKAIYVTTRDGNFAESLYQRVLGVERCGVIENYGSGNEVILFKRVDS